MAEETYYTTGSKAHRLERCARRPGSQWSVFTIPLTEARRLEFSFCHTCAEEPAP